ncbi:class I SAM-dependent methyltransferase [Daejeonella oryzae]|uniref:class I SAM-dependent methyltransferase n=1 Tax=Daejeonella oryzae TaxID=1122943 RepID=UPI0004042299|nr:methyltransferase domain-containing protein [Daejeonella oryzae]
MSVKDIFGKSLSDYFLNHTPVKLYLHNSYGSPEEMPVDIFFRDKNEMPDLEHYALAECKGKVLDIGAGVGSHALILQENGIEVTALEISEMACKIMKLRGVKRILNQSIYSFKTEKFDTLLMLMNGIGLTGTIAGLKDFLHSAKQLLNPAGQLLFDSSDISYLYLDDEIPKNHYFGEISYQYEYMNQKGPWFNWLYIDYPLLNEIASKEGWNTELIYEDDQDQYLVRLTLK